MKATLLHNPGAGKGEWSKPRLLALMAEAGIECEYWGFDAAPLDSQALFDKDAPIIVAGGDGAVSRVLKGLNDRSRPVAILPTGGSNNMARSLEVFGPIPIVARRLPTAERRCFGLLRAEHGTGATRIAEAFGVGALNRSMDKDAKTRSTEEKREHGRSLAVDAIARAKPIGTGIAIDGRPVEEEVLFVEALNLPMIGPHLRLAGDPHDAGRVFNVAWLPAEDAASFMEWLEGPAGKKPAPLRRAKAERLTLTGVTDARVDDAFPTFDGGDIVITHDPPPFELLAPVLKDEPDE
jgi:diacylglycerol kinase (ATP)